VHFAEKLTSEGDMSLQQSSIMHPSSSRPGSNHERKSSASQNSDAGNKLADLNAILKGNKEFTIKEEDESDF